MGIPGVRWESWESRESEIRRFPLEKMKHEKNQFVVYQKKISFFQRRKLIAHNFVDFEHKMHNCKINGPM